MSDTLGVTLGVQMGGEDANEATDRYVSELRNLLRKYCSKAYSPDVPEIALILRVDGSVSAFNFEGWEKIKRNRKERYITVDVGVPVWRWKGKTELEIRHYLFENVVAALKASFSRLHRDGVEANEEALFSDLPKVESDFFAGVRRT